MRATSLYLAVCLAGTFGVSDQAWSAPVSAVAEHPAPLVCADTPAHPGLKSADAVPQRGYGDEPGDSMSGHSSHASASDPTPTSSASGSGMLRSRLTAHSAVLDTLGQAHDAPMAGGDTQSLGLTVRPLTAAERQALGVDGGLMVTGVSAGMGLKAGFQPGDVVLSLDGVDVTTPDQFYRLAQKLPHDRPVPVLVHRPTTTLFLPLEAPARR